MLALAHGALFHVAAVEHLAGRNDLREYAAGVASTKVESRLLSGPLWFCWATSWLTSLDESGRLLGARSPGAVLPHGVHAGEQLLRCVAGTVLTAFWLVNSRLPTPGSKALRDQCRTVVTTADVRCQTGPVGGRIALDGTLDGKGGAVPYHVRSSGLPLHFHRCWDATTAGIVVHADDR